MRSKLLAASRAKSRLKSGADSLLCCGLVALLSACGGGGGGGSGASGSTSAAASAAPTIAIAGQAVKGPVADGVVCAYTLTDPREKIACANTDIAGNYVLKLPQGSGDVVLEVTGGTYVDEATGITVALQAPLRTLSRNAADVGNALITPFTEFALVASQSGNVPSRTIFEAKVVELETALGFKGLVSGKPFGGTGADDKYYLAALTALSRKQNADAASLAVTLNALQKEISQCGGASLAMSLAESTKAATPPKIAAQVTGLCVDRLVIDGMAQDFGLLRSLPYPAGWALAREVELNTCADLSFNTLPFGTANLLVSVGDNARFSVGGLDGSGLTAPIGLTPTAILNLGTVTGSVVLGNTGTTTITVNSGSFGSPGAGTLLVTGSGTSIITASTGSSGLGSPGLVISGSNVTPPLISVTAPTGSENSATLVCKTPRGTFASQINKP